ncbi:MAG TPA: cell division protein FtsQ/DivIB [Steroidobacteraceae bacterium]|nr:cell division protein FtsQ/DivIB [Steroidobacteraceae bacterium]
MLTPKPRRNKRISQENGPRWQLPALNWRRIGTLGGGVLLALALVFGLRYVLDQPIERVEVRGHFQRVSQPDVEKIVRARLAGAGLLSIDLDNLGRGLKSLPWIDSVTVQRSWPRGLVVSVVEQNAVALWNNSGLLNARGELFLSDARFLPPELPRLSGPLGTEAEVTARYLSSQGRLTESGMRLVRLALDERGAWELTLDNGIVIRLGRRDVDARFDRFMSAGAPLLAQRATDVAYIDMRYSSGFAVGWRTGGTHLAGGNKSAGDQNPDG